MKFDLIWTENLSIKENEPVCIRDLCFSPDGEQLLVAANHDINIYGTKDRLLITSLKAHKDVITSIAYSKDGKRFASASADKHVIIWTNKLEGVLKFSHSDIVKCVKYNPITHQLVSCSTTDFALWSLEQKAVSKIKISNAINCCAWSDDGHLLAFGLVSGTISVRNRNGEEKFRIDKNSSSPIWCVMFRFDMVTEENCLISIDFDRKMKFLELENKSELFEQDVGFDAQFLQDIQGPDFFMTGGSNKQVNLYTKDGIFLSPICDKQSSWIRKAEFHSTQNLIAFCTNDGNLSLVSIKFDFIYSVHRERYAFRERMTDVVIQHLRTDNKIRIKCHKLVQNLALNRNRLVIQLPERYIIYELSKEDDLFDMHYRIKQKIYANFECEHLIVFTDCILLLKDKQARCYTFDGMLSREWTFDHKITSFQPTGGPVELENALIGLENGQILQLFLKNAFPVNIIKLESAISVINLNLSRQYLAVVDVNDVCFSYQFVERSLIDQELNVNNIEWNQAFDEMLCYTGNGTITVKVSQMISYHQQLNAKIIAFIGIKVFYLQNKKICSIEITQSISMYQFIEKKDFKKAYKVACLNVTDFDWDQLANSSLEELELDISRKCFYKNPDYLYLTLINAFLDSSSVHNKASELSFLGDVFAFKKQFNQACKYYLKAGHNDKAISMYTDLRMFDMAQSLIQSSKNELKYQELVVQKAQWAESMNNEPRLAAEMYLSAGEFDKALNLMDSIDATDLILNTARNLDKAEHVKLGKCAKALAKHNQHNGAAEIFLKIGDYNNLVNVYILTKNWNSAFKLANQHPELLEIVYLPYANWLAENDRFVEAQKAFFKAGKMKQAFDVLQQLTKNAIKEQRFNDASYYCWILSLQYLDLSGNQKLDENQRTIYLKRFHDLQEQADIYFAYQRIHRFVEEPFTTYFPDVIFNIARYLFHVCLGNESKTLPEGISKVYILYTLAKQSRELQAFKFARLVYERLNNLYLNPRLKEVIELGQLTIRAKPFNDSEDLLPLCYRCSTMNPLDNPKGNFCVNCNEKFIYSFSTFEVLPLIELHLEDNLTDEDAIKILEKSHEISFENRIASERTNKRSEENRWLEERNENTELLKLNLNENSTDNFIENLNVYDDQDKLDRDKFAQLNPNEILVLDWPSPLRKRFVRNMVPEICVTRCSSCNKFFQTDDYETQILMHGACVFCRQKT